MSRLSSFKRLLTLEFSANRALILFGPRKVGKTTLLYQLFPKAEVIDLLKTDLRTRYEQKPSLLREEVLAQNPKVIILDEIQKVPSLVDEIHWCLENTKTKFILCGSSARSLKNEIGGLLGGRAWRFDLFPLTTHEIIEPDLDKILNHGLIPSHYLSNKPNRDLKAYITDYIEEEIRKESKLKSIPAFYRFLETAGKLSGDLVNYANVGSECGVSSKTVRSYYQILEDTLIGFRLPPYEHRKDRRLIETEKFYMFDCGVTKYLKRIDQVKPETSEYGKIYENFLIQEIRAYHSYREKLSSLTFWRTSNRFEVDLIVGEMEVAIEFKSSDQIKGKDFKNMRTLSSEHPKARKIIVSRDEKKRITEDKIEIWPWKSFCKSLWNGEIY